MMSATSFARAKDSRSSSTRRAQTGTQMRAFLALLISQSHPRMTKHYGRTVRHVGRGTRRSSVVARAFGGHVVEQARRTFGDARRRDDLARVPRRKHARALRRRRDSRRLRDVSVRRAPLFLFREAYVSRDAFAEHARSRNEHPEPPNVPGGCPLPRRERAEDERQTHHEAPDRAFNRRLAALSTATPAARVVIILFVESRGELARDG